jgi:hypothetical protein
MKALSKRYDLGIPDEVLNNRQAMANIAIGTKMASARGVKDTGQAAAFGIGYMAALQRDPSNVARALEEGFKASQSARKTGDEFVVSGHVTDPQNRTVFYDKQGNFKQTNQQTRPPQPPFNITPAGVDARAQAGREKDENNARGTVKDGRAWERLPEQERNKRIEAYRQYRLFGTPLPAFVRGSAAPAAPSPAAPGNRPPLDQFYRQ